MALGITNRGTGTSYTGGSHASDTLTPTGNFAASSLAILAIGGDNSGSAGASSGSSISDTKGNTWTFFVDEINDPGAANAGNELVIWVTQQDGGALTTSDTITINYTSNLVACVATLTEITSTLGYPVPISSGTSTQGSSTTPSITTASAKTSQVVFGAVNNQNVVTYTADSDTTNGTWSTQQSLNCGVGTSGQSIASQAKILTGTGTQTYNVTASVSSTWSIGYIVIREFVRVIPATLAVTATPFAPVPRGSAIPGAASLTMSAFRPTVNAPADELPIRGINALADLILETSTTTGLGNIVLAGAVTNYLPVSSLGDGAWNFFKVSMVSSTGVPIAGGWEIFWGKYTLSSNSISRFRIISNIYNRNQPIGWAAGTKRVAVVQPASDIIDKRRLISHALVMKHATR
jgi:hypothetical protein